MTDGKEFEAQKEVEQTAEVIKEAVAKDDKVKEEKIEKLEKKDKEEHKKEVEAEKKGKRNFRGRRGGPTTAEIIEAWEPKTKLGREVKDKKIKSVDDILKDKKKILEPEIVDSLIELKSDLLSIGQSKGKFGGGKRRAWRQTQRKTKEGNVPKFSTMAVIGDENGHVGIGSGKAKETLPARDKAIRKAKLNVIKITRGDGSFDSVGGGNASIPFEVEGKCGSVKVKLMPAAPGTGLVVGDQLKKILKMAGIKDVYGKTSGRKRTSFNLAKACMDALIKTNRREKK
jgi:small subunit ribosomal protein S5